MRLREDIVFLLVRNILKHGRRRIYVQLTWWYIGNMSTFCIRLLYIGPILLSGVAVHKTVISLNIFLGLPSKN